MGSSPTSGNYARSRKTNVPKLGANPAWAHKMRADRFELPTFCSGVKRATVAPYPLCQTQRATTQATPRKTWEQHNGPHSKPRAGVYKGPPTCKPDSPPLNCNNAGPGMPRQPHGNNKPQLGNNNCANCGVQTHAQLPALALKSNPLTTRANWH